MVARGNLAPVARRRSHYRSSRYARAAGGRQELAMLAPVDTPTAIERGQGRLRRVRDWRIDPTLLAGIRWQDDAFTYYRVIGQIRKVENTKANTGAACRLRVKQLGADGEPEDTTDERALRVMRALKGPTGGVRQLIATFMLLADIAGEAFLLGTPTLTPPEAAASELRGDSPGLVWEFVSRQEIRGDKSSVPARHRVVRDRTGALSISARRVPDDAFVARWHHPDPEFSEQPDSPMRSVIPDASEYVQLRDVVTGAIQSRMSAGMLIVPKDASISSAAYDDSQSGDGQDVDDESELVGDLLDHMEAPVLNRRDPASFVPMVIATENVEAMQHIRVEPLSKDNNTEWATPLRKEKLEMIAQSLDSTPEEMQGKAEVNHWGTYSLNQEFVSKWVIPRLEELAEFLTNDYLRNMLEIYEGMSPQEAEQFVIVADPSNILARADKGVTAIRLGDRGWLAVDEVLIANGFDPDQRPDDEEQARRFVVDLVMKAPELLPAFAEFLGLANLIDVEKLEELLERRNGTGGGTMPVELPDGADDDQEQADDDASRGDGPDGDMPPVTNDDPEGGGGEKPSGGGIPPLSALVDQLHIAADMAAEQAVTRAASRVINLSSKAGADPTVKDRLTGRAKDQVFMLVSDADLRRLDTTPEALLQGAFDAFGARATLLVSRWLADELAAPQRDVGWRTTEVVNQLVHACTATILDSGGDRRFAGHMIPRDAIATILEAEVPHAAGVH